MSFAFHRHFPYAENKNFAYLLAVAGAIPYATELKLYAGKLGKHDPGTQRELKLN